MHAASLASPRLQRVLALLADRRAHTTRDIVRRARVMAVSACVAELRVRGAAIDCEARVDAKGQRRFWYTMTRAPAAAETSEATA